MFVKLTLSNHTRCHLVDRLDNMSEKSFFKKLKDCFVVEDRPIGIKALIRNDFQEAVYLVNKEANFCAVIPKGKTEIVTVYRASTSKWLPDWMSTHPKASRKDFFRWSKEMVDAGYPSDELLTVSTKVEESYPYLVSTAYGFSSKELELIQELLSNIEKKKAGLPPTRKNNDIVKELGFRVTYEMAVSICNKVEEYRKDIYPANENYARISSG